MSNSTVKWGETAPLTAKIWAREWLKELYLDALYKIRLSLISEHWRKFFELYKPSIQNDIDFCHKLHKTAKKEGWLKYYPLNHICKNEWKELS